MNGQRLRERAAQYGVGSLENDELVAIVLGHRDTGHAKEVLDNAGGIDRLAGATADDHRRMHRVGPAAATRLSAAVELGRRTTIPRDDKPEKMTSPRMFARYLLPRYGAGATEQLGVLSLNSRYGLLRDIILTRGTVDETPLSPRELFRTALLTDAATIIIWHNHPSGDPTPSEDDIALTERVTEAGNLMNIQLLDHIILTRASYYSFKEHGRL
ncbi:MAG: DNA repair protein RadC [Acidobacteriota bacterium]|nr:DNA repair protein RadC [Acidobacteriota bacterium]